MHHHDVTCMNHDHSTKTTGQRSSVVDDVGLVLHLHEGRHRAVVFPGYGSVPHSRRQLPHTISHSPGERFAIVMPWEVGTK